MQVFGNVTGRSRMKKRSFGCYYMTCKEENFQNRDLITLLLKNVKISLR